MGINLKCDPQEADFLRSVYQDVVPAWHMNKQHWNTVHPGGAVDAVTLFHWIEASYRLTKGRTKK